MRKIVCFALCCIISGCAVKQSASLKLEEGFMNPPHSARPQVWWHWMNGNVTEEGIFDDIMWFNRIGLGGFHVFDASFETPQIVPDRLAYMTDEWRKAFRLAVNMADSLGMDVTIPSSPGFSSTGGPWVKPENAMKKVVWREVEIEGGQMFEGELPAPFTSTGKFQNYPLKTSARVSGPVKESYYEDIAILAARLPKDYKGLRELGATVSSSGGVFDLEQLTNGDLSDVRRLPAGKDGYAWIQYEFPEPQTIRAISVVNSNTRHEGHAVPAFCEDSLQISDDGINFQTIMGIPVGDAHRQTISFDDITARYFRLKHRNPKAYYHYTMSHRNPDPEYSEIAEFILYPQLRINLSEAKSAFAAAHDQNMYRTLNSGSSDVLDDVVDITECYSDGVLRWDAPDGRWRIYRFGASLTGKKNHPASPEATGFEVDKLDPDAWEDHFRNYINMNKDAVKGKLGKRGIRNLLLDSYEASLQNWTSDLLIEFARRRKYDPLKWLPVLTGAIVTSTEDSEKFLFDWRKTIGELFEENYSSIDSFVRKEYGMKGCFIEAHANGRVFTADGMSMKKNAAYPMSEIWIQGPVGTKDRELESVADIRESASVAHIYGQNITAAESFTAIGVGAQAYTFCPENLKPSADLAMAHGVNLFVIHDSAHQPLDSHKPGLGLGVYGQWFNRHEIWAEQAGAWINYLARSSFMLQQGKAVADILWYYGEDNNVTGLYSHSFPDVPNGYNFDFANSEVLMNEIYVRDGQLCTRTGMKYSVLCLDRNALPLSQEVRAKIEYFINRGVKVCGYHSQEIQAALKDCGVERDWVYAGTDALNFVHRTLPDAEIYWISSPSLERKSTEVSLRVSGMKPYLWHPVTGAMRELSYEFVDGRTEMQLEFNPHESYFIVFMNEARESSFISDSDTTSQLCDVDGTWDVEFRSPFGEIRTVNEYSLSDWSLDDDRWIRHFSGIATYSKLISVPEYDGRLILDLGSVRNVAEVFVNDKKVVTLWTSPFSVDITDYLTGTEFKLEVKVSNLWVNRLIGDAALDVNDRMTYTHTSFYGPADSLLAAGLIGPVKLDVLNK